MKKLILLLTFLINVYAFAQEKLYNPEADAKKDIENAVTKAKEEHKYVILQVGGNWCSWCILFHNYINENAEIKKLKEDNFVYYHLNYSKENQNLDILKQYNNPQRFGFPVLLVLDENGTLIHTQDSGYLESCTEKNYDAEKVERFLSNWKKSNFVTAENQSEQSSEKKE